jgi:hypothetical protein
VNRRRKKGEERREKGERGLRRETEEGENKREERR